MLVFRLNIWCWVFETSEHLNTWDSISNNYLSVGYSTVKYSYDIRHISLDKTTASIHIIQLLN